VRDDRERLLDIQEAIANIERYAVRGREAFERDELIQTWIVRRLEIIMVSGYRDAKHTCSPLFRYR
jgi:uncharacterized protein with HEPN domain